MPCNYLDPSEEKIHEIVKDYISVVNIEIHKLKNRLDKKIVSTTKINEAINFIKNSQVSINDNDALLLGDLSEVIRILTGQIIDHKELKYNEFDKRSY